MNLGASESAANSERRADIAPSRAPDLRVAGAGAGPGRQPRAVAGGLFQFIEELRRRKVCRAITSYCVGLWLICQVLDIVSPQLGLPDWTLRFAMVIGLSGIPVAIVLSWLFDVTPSGLVLEGAETTRIVERRERPSADRLIDVALLVAALAIGTQLLLTRDGGVLDGLQDATETVAVLPFALSADRDAPALSERLQVELQHQLHRAPTIKVIAPKDPDKVAYGSTLRGAIVLRDNQVSVTALLVNNESGELTWSAVFWLPFTDPNGTPGEIARLIVEAPDFPLRFAPIAKVSNVP